jgi:hypothetical protein
MQRKRITKAKGLFLNEIGKRFQAERLREKNLILHAFYHIVYGFF